MSQDAAYSLAEHICFHTYALDRALNRAYQAGFGESGFSYPKYIVLLALAEHGPLTIGALSRHAGVETNTLSPLLKKMAEHGIISRQRSLDDERQVLVDITDYGHEVLAAARPVAESIFSAMGLTEAEAEALAKQLSDIREAVSKAHPTAMVPPKS